MNRASFQIFTRWTLRGKRWFFRYVASNGKIVAQSEAYNSKGAARNGIDTIRTDSVTARIILINEDGTQTVQ